MMSRHLSKLLQLAVSQHLVCRGAIRTASNTKFGSLKPLKEAHAENQIGDLTFTFQKDITLNNLNEIIESMDNDASGDKGHRYYYSYNIMRAMTINSDRPWWTARDQYGNLAAYVLMSHVGETYCAAGQWYISSKLRGHKVGTRMYHRAIEDLLSCYPERSFLTAYKRGEGFFLKLSHPDTCYEDYYMKIILKEPNYDPSSDILKKTGDGFHIKRFSRGVLFDKLVQYDTSVVQVPRPEFLAQYLDPKITTTYMALDDDSGDVVGYGALQPSFDPSSCILAPLYAQNQDIASVLLHYLLQEVEPGNKIMFTYHEKNQFMEDLTQKVTPGGHLVTTAHGGTGKDRTPVKLDQVFCQTHSAISLA